MTELFTMWDTLLKTTAEKSTSHSPSSDNLRKAVEYALKRATYEAAKWGTASNAGHDVGFYCSVLGLNYEKWIRETFKILRPNG